MTDPLTGPLLGRRPLTNAVVIDAHAHLGSYARFFIPSPDSDAMVRVMDRCGVQQAVLSSHLAIAQDSQDGNELTARATERHPGRLLGYIVANPHQDPQGELDRWAGHPAMVGIKLHPDLHEYPLTGPGYAPVWDHAARTGMPVLTHTWAGSSYNDLEQVREVATGNPGVRILAGHAGALRSGYPAMIDMALQCGNVYLEVCGTYLTRHWLEQMVRTLGPERVLYGSDFPFIDLRYSIGRVVFARLSLAERLSVLGGAMSKLLGQRRLDQEVVP